MSNVGVTLKLLLSKCPRNTKMQIQASSYQINWEKGQRYWRPISLLKICAKLVSKVLAESLKTVLPSLISSNQTAYLNGRFISEGGRLISDIFEVSDLLKLKGLLLTVDIEKTFDSVNQFPIKSIRKLWL